MIMSVLGEFKGLELSTLEDSLKVNSGGKSFFFPPKNAVDTNTIFICLKLHLEWHSTRNSLNMIICHDTERGN